MHKNIYNIKAAFFCNENLIKSLEEVKPFLGFDLNKPSNLNQEIDKNFDILVVESKREKELQFYNIKIPKVLVKTKTEKTKMKYDLVITLPVSLSELRQMIINLSQKKKFEKNSLIKIKNYTLNKNERIFKKDNKKIQVTEKEIFFIKSLFFSKKPLNKNFILEKVWGYSTGTDTHTVETHIYRLRQKIKNHFDDVNFIKHSERGYSI